MGSIFPRLEPACVHFPPTACVSSIYFFVATLALVGNDSNFFSQRLRSRAVDVVLIQEATRVSDDGADVSAANGGHKQDEVDAREESTWKLILLDWHIHRTERSVHSISLGLVKDASRVMLEDLGWIL